MGANISTGQLQQDTTNETGGVAESLELVDPQLPFTVADLQAIRNYFMAGDFFRTKLRSDVAPYLSDGLSEFGMSSRGTVWLAMLLCAADVQLEREMSATSDGYLRTLWTMDAPSLLSFVCHVRWSTSCLRRIVNDDERWEVVIRFVTSLPKQLTGGFKFNRDLVERLVRQPLQSVEPKLVFPTDADKQRVFDGLFDDLRKRFIAQVTSSTNTLGITDASLAEFATDNCRLLEHCRHCMGSDHLDNDSIASLAVENNAFMRLFSSYTCDLSFIANYGNERTKQLAPKKTSPFMGFSSSAGFGGHGDSSGGFGGSGFGDGFGGGGGFGHAH